MKDIFFPNGSVVSVCDMPEQKIVVNGREWRFDYDKRFGPLWLKKDGSERKCQNPNRAVWRAFNQWLERTSMDTVETNQDPLIIIQNLQQKIIKYRAALERLRDCDWVITLPDRMDGVRAIAREALDD